jgi:hypothetical protein
MEFGNNLNLSQILFQKYNWYNNLVKQSMKPNGQPKDRKCLKFPIHETEEVAFAIYFENKSAYDCNRSLTFDCVCGIFLRFIFFSMSEVRNGGREEKIE